MATVDVQAMTHPGHIRCPSCGAELRPPARFVNTITALLVFGALLGFAAGYITAAVAR